MCNITIYHWVTGLLILLLAILAIYLHQKSQKKHKKSIKKLKREGDIRYRDLSNLLPQLVVELDKDGQFSFINDAGLEFLGYSKFEIKNGFSIFQIIHPDDLSNFKEEFLYLLEGGVNKGQEFRIVTKGGESFFVVLFLKAIETEDYSQAGLRGFIIDITDRKKLERQVLSAILETEDKERRRYSEDLHDGLGPLLSTIKLYINQMKSKKVSKEEENEMFTFANELLDEAISTTRNIANNILPGSIVDNGLVAAINSFCHRVKQAGTIQIIFNHNINSRFNNNVEINFYRIIIELVNNSIKHGNAKSVEISLIFDDNKLVLNYIDDGVGFDVNTSELGLGINNIKNRSQSLNGEYQFKSEANHGMTFSLDVKMSNIDL